MRNLFNWRALAAPAAFAALGCSAAWAGVTVTFVEPDRFVDVPFSLHDRDDALKRIEAHFAKLGATLPAGQDLKVEVTEVDLAGTEYPGRGGRDLRVLKGMADWPRIEFKYAIESAGKVLKSGTASVKDMNYLNRHNRYPRDEPLRYEKRMLDDWFQSELAGKS
jgi:hypothetical protein